MAVLLPSDEYWFEIKFKPKYSKWLQTTISEVNEKLKAIAKLVEEDADSFSRRSEIYFENRPLIMKMVQDLYRSYRSLADRYDIATRALSQTHLICESFSNQSDESPHDMSDMSTHGISDMAKKLKGMIDLLEGVADSFAKRAEMYYKHRPKLMKLVEELYRAFQTLAERHDKAAMYMNRAYHTISEALINQSPPSVSASEDDSSDMKTHINSPLDHDELQNGAFGTPKNVHLVKRSVTFPQMDSVSEIAGLAKEISNLSDEINILKDQTGKETRRANNAEKDVLDLTNAIKNLSVEKDATEAQCKIYNKQLIQMEEELAKAEKDVKGLADGWSREVQKIGTLENSNRALKRELERLKGEFEPSVVQSEKKNWMNNKEEFEPWSLQKKQLQQQAMQQQKDNDELILVLREELERIKIEAEDAVYLLRKEIDRLTEQNLSYEITINEVESKSKKSIEKNRRLESEIEFLREKLWIYIGKQERIVLNNEPRLGNDVRNTLTESFKWSDFFVWMFFGRLRPLKTHLSTFLQSIMKAIMVFHNKYSSKWIRKKDDQSKEQLLPLHINESEKEEKIEEHEKEEMESFQIISQQ